MNLKKIVLLLILAEINISSGVLFLDSFLKQQPIENQAAEKLLVLSNYRGEDLANESIMAYFLQNIEELLDSNLSHKKNLAATFLESFLKNKEVLATVSKKSNDLALLAYEILSDPNVNTYKIDTLSDDEYLDLKTKFKQYYLQGVRLAQMSDIEGFFDIIENTVYWYPPQANINAFFQQKPNLAVLLNKIKINPDTFLLSNNSVFAYNKLVRELQKTSKKEEFISGQLVGALHLLWMTINRGLWTAFVETEKTCIELSKEPLKEVNSLTLSESLCAILQTLDNTNFEKVYSSLDQASLYELFILTQELIESKYYLLFDKPAQIKLDKIAKKMHVLAKPYKTSEGKDLSIRQACSILVPKNIDLSTLNLVSQALDVLKNAAKQNSEYCNDKSVVTLLELAALKVLFLEVGSDKKTWKSVLVKLGQLVEFLNTTNSFHSDRWNKILDEIGNTAGYFFERCECDESLQQSVDLNDYKRMIENNILDPFKSKSVFINGVIKLASKISILAQQPPAKSLFLKNELTEILAKAIKTLVKKSYLDKDAWTEIALLDAVSILAQKARDFGMIEEELFIDLVGKSSELFLQQKSKDKAAKVIELNIRQKSSSLAEII